YRGYMSKGDPARSARDVSAHGCPVAVCRRLIARGGSSRGKNPTRDSDELARPTETDERVKTKQRDDRDGEHLRTQASLEPSCEWRVADGEEHRRHRKRQLRGYPEDELRRRLAFALLEHARCGE